MKVSQENLIESFITTNPDLKNQIVNIKNAFNVLKNCFARSGKLLICGNGGSAADSLHIVGELQKDFKIKRSLNEQFILNLENMEDGHCLAENLSPGLPAVSLVSEVSLLTAISNDMGANYCFAQQVLSLGKENDVLFCISTSGNSSNIVFAAETAKALGLKVISLIGNNSTAKLKKYSDIVIDVPHSETFRIQEYHLPVYHLLCALIELEFYAE